MVLIPIPLQLLIGIIFGGKLLIPLVFSIIATSFSFKLYFNFASVTILFVSPSSKTKSGATK